jgi:hypothetical protein
VINSILSQRGPLLNADTVVDATLNATPASTQNDDKA